MSVGVKCSAVQCSGWCWCWCLVCRGGDVAQSFHINYAAGGRRGQGQVIVTGTLDSRTKLYNWAAASGGGVFGHNVFVSGEVVLL